MYNGILESEPLLSNFGLGPWLQTINLMLQGMNNLFLFIYLGYKMLNFTSQ